MLEMPHQKAALSIRCFLCSRPGHRYERMLSGALAVLTKTAVITARILSGCDTAAYCAIASH